MTDAIKLHETAATSVDRHKETKEQRKARVLARKKAREAEKELMKQLEIAAKKKQLLEEKKHEYEDRELTNSEIVELAERGHRAIHSGIMHNVNLWYCETQVRHGGYTDASGKRRRTYDVLGYNQRNIVSEAAAKGHIESLRKMLQVNAATGLPDGTGRTALHLAITEGHLDCAVLLIMHDIWKEWKHNRQLKKNRKNKKNGLVVEGKSSFDGMEKGEVEKDAAYERAIDIPVKEPQCKAVLENLLRCPDDVAENGFCTKQRCKMQGFNIVKEKMAAARARGENFDAYEWNKNPYENLINSKPIAVARAKKMHHVVTILDGLVRFSRKAFHGLLDVVECIKTNNSKAVAKSLLNVDQILIKRKRIGAQPTKKGVCNPLHDDLLSLHGLLAAYVNTPQTPTISGTVSVGSHVAQLIGTMINKARRDHPTCWSLQCERNYELLITTAADDVGCVNRELFKSEAGLWLDETERCNEWITDIKRLEKGQVKPKMAKGWDVNGYIG
jgi:hypothetical protein